MTSSKPVADLGEKLDHLEGVLGYKFDARYFRSSYLAELCRTSPTQWSRKRGGGEAVSNFELSKLVDRFELGPKLDYRLFRLDLDAFKAALEQAGVGTYGPRTGNRYRQMLIDAADRRKRIAICRAEDSQRGGIGRVSDASMSDARLYVGDLVYLHIPIPAAGHLVVLNDDRKAETHCLMPSLYAPHTAVTGNSVQVPTSLEYPYLAVADPAGRYRIFAIWTADPLLLAFLDNLDADAEPALLTENDLAQLATTVGHLQGQQERLKVVIGDYEVLSVSGL